MMEHQCCSLCGESKPRTRAYFHPRKDTRSGYASGCRRCMNARARQNVKTLRRHHCRRVAHYLSRRGCACGERDPRCLLFTNIDGSVSAVVNRLARSTTNWPRIQEAMMTHVVRCHNCAAKMRPSAPWASPLLDDDRETAG